MGHARNEWGETALLLRLGGGERERAHCSSMKCTVERDYILPLGVIARQLEGALNRFRAGIAVINSVRAGHGSNLGEPLRQGHHIFVIKVRARHVNQFGRLLLNGSNHVRMAVSGRNDGDAGGEIKKLVSVNIGDNDAASAVSPPSGYERV